MSDEVGTVLTREHILKAKALLEAPRCHYCGGIVDDGQFAHEPCLKRRRELEEYIADLAEQLLGRPRN